MADTLRAPGPELLAALEAALGPGGVVPPEPRHLEEPRGRFRGTAAAVLRPADTAAVAAAVRLCAAARVGIVPYGGGTGLVGGQVRPLGPSDGPPALILALDRLDRIRALDTTDNVAVAEAGVVLADLQSAAEAAGRLFPLSLAAEGTARIGGNLATNAGGTNVLRYGNARDLALGLEAVLADGSVHHGLRRLRKDNTGYDLRHLLIGSEGTLGVITAASLRLFPRPAETATTWTETADPAAALALLQHLQDRLGETLSGFEIMARRGLDFLADKLPQVARPVADPGPWSVLIEAGAGRGAGLGARFESALADAIEAGLAGETLIAQNAAQRDAFWRVRESIPEANRLIGAVTSHDLSLPLSQIPAFIARADAALAAIDPGLRVNAFGHLGDGNLHYNVFPAAGRDRADYDDRRAAITGCVHDLVDSFGGSVSAEHGIGRLKTGDLVKYGDPAKLAAMRAIKAALDPHGILNPGAVLG
jgi:FAD/FMN-containing dehydrogenase